MEITLDWPEVRNALGPAEGRKLRKVLEAVATDEKCAAVVLTANGKAFCAGGNLPEIVRLAQQGAEAVKTTIYGEFQGVFRAIRECPVPVIAAVDGAAIGFGCDLALACNVTFIGSNGWLAQGWTKAGLIPATGGTLYVTHRAGQHALWQLLCADRIDAATANRLGLGIACDSARTAALDMAETLATLPRRALKAITRLAVIEDIDEHLAAALEYQIGFITDPAFAAQAEKLLAR
ncbi:enoyl-CoA hydratase/carnithine racemase [Pseudomonas sp. JAI111]|uniref:enoyl-CoA hydratase/isomerase family protein n=1 Tax=Pseudomonas sp. JAI111 TaxID=2735913 RepID=UPI0021688E96|nr:enoyl-CoA hydratase/isomerase family protein [Pseudomonas sp. JAI111]MCS3835679.1 enoyl-CoA hydratase/carnithine racemase [Pseudomonas sp. JAI111]